MPLFNSELNSSLFISMIMQWLMYLFSLELSGNIGLIFSPILLFTLSVLQPLYFSRMINPNLKPYPIPGIFVIGSKDEKKSKTLSKLLKVWGFVLTLPSSTSLKNVNYCNILAYRSLKNFFFYSGCFSSSFITSSSGLIYFWMSTMIFSRNASF